jgi:hypothetical protein
MPHPSWTHTCRKTGRTRSGGTPFRCWRCFGQADFAGWGNSVIEMMVGYQRRYGLKCIGPHRKLADEMLKSAFNSCGVCQGTGVVDDGSHGSCVACAACDGFGWRPAVPEEEIERRRAIVLTAFPDAASPQPRRIASRADERANADSLGPSVHFSAAQPRSTALFRGAVATEKPDFGEWLRAGVAVLFLAPAWLFASLSAFREGRLLVGLVFGFASGFAALSGLMAAAPASFDRRWVLVWGALGAGLLLLLGIVTGQVACAGWNAGGS